jgi:deazaflavin-dependent oxidoreductase (nitroreductase family)
MSKALNPLIAAVAGRKRMATVAQIHHRGRRSGRPYVTSAGARLAGDVFVIPLTFGTESDWSRNVRAAGGCTIRWKGSDYTVLRPEICDADSIRPLILSAFRPAERVMFRMLGIKLFMRLELLTTPQEHPGAR